MPLNYSKWDALELSDDSDIEGHPNVDHKSLVRWKQRDIHEKREARKRRIAELKAIIALNDDLIPRAEAILIDVDENGPSKYSAIVERLQTESRNKEKGNNDEILSNILVTIRNELKDKGVATPSGDQLVEKLKERLVDMRKSKSDSVALLEDEEKEQKKKITSEDIHDGFASTNMTHEEPAPTKSKGKGKATETPSTTSRTTASGSTAEIEVLNPRTSAPISAPVEATEDDDDEERIPELTGALLEFSKIPIGKFEKSFGMIQAHPREIIHDTAYDELVIAGFRAAMSGDPGYAKQCVHQALIVQYCQKLGKDGVSLFFKRMSSGDKRAVMVFQNDLDQTYNMMITRAASAKAEDENGARERIQLVAEDPSQTITFNVPDGPPPETIKLEGPGTEGLDLEEVKAALQRRWDIFTNFDEKLQTALKSGKLDDVNDVLGDMEVSEAEDVVKLLEIAGILSFSRDGIVDQTGKEGEASGATVEEVDEKDKEKTATPATTSAEEVD